MIVQHDIVYVNGREVEIQAKQVADNNYLAQWSFGGKTFESLNKTYATPAEALLMARMGAFLASVHTNKMKGHGE